MKTTNLSLSQKNKVNQSQANGDSITIKKKRPKSELLLAQTQKLIDRHPEKTLEVLRKWIRDS